MIPEKSNIALFSFAFKPFEGGAEIAAREAMERLKGLNFTVFTHKFDRAWLAREKAGNIGILRVGMGICFPGGTSKYYGRILDKILYIFRAWRLAEKEHAEKRFKVIWALMASYGGVAALFFKLNHPTIPLFLTIQEGDSESHLRYGKFGLVGFFWKRMVKNADYISAISNYLADLVKKSGAKCPVAVIPNGVDILLFSTRYKESEMLAARQELDIKDDYIISTTSRLVWKNGVDILLEAVALLKKKIFNVKLLIIGGGPERGRLERLAKKLGLERNIIFLGQLPQRDLPLYLKISDVFARPSRSEGLGNSFLEAMAAGLPVIGTPVGGIVDFLKDGENGLAVRVGDPRDLADKLGIILTKPDIRRKISAAGQSLAKRDYSWDKITSAYEEIFDNLINQ